MAGDRGKGNPLGTKGVERFLRGLFNPQGAVQYALDVKGDIQPNVEVRPFHPWDFAEFSIRPGILLQAIGAVAAEHGYVEIQQHQQGYDICITHIRVNQAASIRFMTASVGDVAGATLFSRDNQVLPFNVPSAPVAYIVAATAVPGAFAGQVVWQLTANETMTVPIVIRSTPAPAGFLVINADTVNQAITIQVAGFLLPQNVGNV